MQHCISDNNGQIEKDKKIVAQSDDIIEECRQTLIDIESEQGSLQKKKVTFDQYREGIIIQRDIEDLEARYETITGNISSDLQHAEEEKERSQQRFQKSEEYLYEYTSSNGVKDTDYTSVSYNSYRKQEIKRSRDQLKENQEVCEKAFHKCDKEISVEDSKLAELRKNLEKVTGEKNPLDRSRIVVKKYKEEIAIKKQEALQRKSEKDSIEKKRHILENAGSSFDAYSDFMLVTTLAYDEAFMDYEASDWKQYNGIE